MQMIVSSRAKIQGNRTSDQELAALLGVSCSTPSFNSTKADIIKNVSQMTVEALRGSWTDFDKSQ